MKKMKKNKNTQENTTGTFQKMKNKNKIWQRSLFESYQNFYQYNINISYKEI